MKTNKASYTDLNFLRQNTSADPELMIEMINIYLEQTPETIRILKDASQSGDWPRVKAAAHKLKPSFRLIGIPDKYKMTAIAIEELAVNEDDPGKIKSLINELEKTCDLVYEELNNEVQELEQQLKPTNK